MSESGIFKAAVKLSPESRAAYLDEACGSDHDLRREVESLLRAHDDGGSFLHSQAPRPSVTVDAASLPESLGTRIGPYKLLQKLGEGGMGAVYMAEQQEPVRRMVALKIIRPGMDSSQISARFEAERQALALMDHPNIAKVYDAGSTDSGRPYFVMELVKGIPITRFCDEYQLTPRQRLELFLPVCQAVQHAHTKGIIHRDLKPSNVLVALYDDKPVPKVIDFGVAKATGDKLTDRTLFTGFGAFVGTLEYMSPEQAKLNALDIDTRSDVYSLGVLLYELLTGSTPLEHGRLKQAALDELLRIIREEEPPKPSTRLSASGQALAAISSRRGTEPAKLGKALRGELDWIVMKALEKDRTRRYETANGLARDIERHLHDEPVEACPPTLGYRLRKFSRKNKKTLGMAAAALLLLLLAGAALWREQQEQQRQQAALEQGIGEDLGVADMLQAEERWPEALQVLERAQARLKTGGPQHLRDRVEQQRKNVTTVNLLEEARLQATAGRIGEQSAYDYAGAVNAYAAAFANNGLDLEMLTPEEAAERIHRSAIRTQLVAALDNWSYYAKQVRASSEKRILKVAGLADDDPWRQQLRDPKVLRDSAALERLSSQPDILDERPTHLVALSQALVAAHKPGAAIRLLRQAQDRFPADFWINFRLAILLEHEEPANPDGLAFHQVAMALRPRSPAVYGSIGYVLWKQGKLARAEAAFRKVIELKPDSASAYNSLAVTLSGQNKLQEAVDTYGKAIALKPNYALAYSNLGNALGRQKKLPEAESAYRKAIEIEPNLSIAYANLGNALREQNKLPEAEAAYRKVTELNPGNADAHYNLGNILKDQKKLPKAAAAYNKAIALKPDFQAAYKSLGDILKVQGNPAGAEAAYRKAEELQELTARRAISVNPNDAAAYKNLGEVLAKNGRLDEAIAAYREALRIGPNSLDTHIFLGNLLRTKNDVAGAIREYQEALRIDQNNTWPHYCLGNVLLDKNDEEAATREYREVLRINPEDTGGLNGLARVLANATDARLRDPKAALTAAKKAVELAPKDFNSWVTLGMAQYRNNDWKGTIETLGRAKEFQASGVRHSIFLAMAYWQLGEKDEARARYHQGVRQMAGAGAKNPSYAEWARYRAEAADLLGMPIPKLDGMQPQEAIAAFEEAMRLGKTLKEKGKFDEASATYQKASRIDPESARAHTELGRVLAAKKDFEGAIREYKEALGIDPSDVMAHNNLGLVRKALNDLKGAIREHEEAIRLNPNFAGAHHDLGLALQADNNVEGAIRAYREAIRLNPSFDGAHSDLADVLANASDPRYRDPKQALAAAQKAVDLAPKKLASWVALGMAQYRNNDWKGTVETLEKAKEFQAVGVRQSIFLAMAHWRLGDQEKARTCYDAAVQQLEQAKVRNADLERLRAEAAELLGVSIPKPASQEPPPEPKK